MLLYDGREEARVVVEAVEPGNMVLVHRKPGRQLRHAVRDENGKGHGLAFGFQRFATRREAYKANKKGEGRPPRFKVFGGLSRRRPVESTKRRVDSVGCPGPQLRYSTRQKPPWNLVGSPLSQHEKM